MKLYTKKFTNKEVKTSLQCNDTCEAESLEQQLRKMITAKEPIPAGEQMLYTEKKDGVHAGYDVRTDRFEVAIDAADRVRGALAAKRQAQEQAKQEPQQPETKTE